MRFSIVPSAVLFTTALCAPLSRDSLGNARASVDVLLKNLHTDRDVAEHAIRNLQTKVLNYRQSVEGYQVWREYVVEQEKAVQAAEKMKAFLGRLGGIYGLRTDTTFQYQGML